MYLHLTKRFLFHFVFVFDVLILKLILSFFLRSPSSVLPPETMPWLLLINDSQEIEIRVKQKEEKEEEKAEKLFSEKSVFDDDEDEFLLLATEGL